MQDLTGFQRDCLLAIATLENPHGLGIKDWMERVLDYKSDGGKIQHGRLYPNLDTLISKGLVEKGKKDQRTNEYTLTGRGEREVLVYNRRWLRAVSRMAKEVSDDETPDLVSLVADGISDTGRIDPGEIGRVTRKQFESATAAKHPDAGESE